jgi:protein TonB
MNKLQTSNRKHIIATLWSLLGLIIVYGGVVAMNELAQPPEKEKTAKATQLQVKKEQKPPPPKKVVKKKKPKRKLARNNPPPAPPAGLDSALAGVDFGVGDFEFADLGNVNKNLFGDTSDVVMTGESVDDPPKATRRPPLEYPRKAKQKGIEGYVVLNMLIDKTGQVVNVRVLESNPTGIFDEVATKGVNEWSFTPAKYKGQPVRVWAKQKLRFELS